MSLDHADDALPVHSPHVAPTEVPMTGKSRVDLEVLVTLGVVTAGEAHRSGGLHPDGVQELARLLEQVSVVATVDAERGGFSTHLSLAPEEVATVAARAASARAQAGGGLL